MQIERRAFAKINLDLRVLAVRGDGYHEVATVLQTLALYDTVRVTRVGDDRPFSLACSDASVPSDERNLVWQAAVRLWNAVGRAGPPRGVAIDLVKRIPAQAGLGGGSADAAVALVALRQAWHIAPSEVDLERLAAGLGADVPFFLVGGTARGVGRGDQVEPWPDVPPLEVVLVMPDFGVRTAEAYAWYDAEGPRGAANIEAPDPPDDWATWLQGCRNDLEAAVFARHERLSRVRAALQGAGARLALMSGSGSTVFGLFSEGGSADQAVRALDASGLVVERTRTLDRAAYSRQALGT